MKKKPCYKQQQRAHPFNAYPFEAFHSGSWCNVEQLRVKDGSITTYFEFDDGRRTEEKVPVSNFRLRSRRANSYDCACFLRPGIDVCVLTTDPNDANAGQDAQPVWVDAKIYSIERKPHEFRCTCHFSVSLSGVHHSLRKGRNKVISEIRELMIDNIAILQQLDRKPCEDGCFRWISSKDCHLFIEAKLFRGQFMYDVSWLLVTSALKGVEFAISSSQNKIMYQVLDGVPDTGGFMSNKVVKALNFKVEGEVMRLTITTLVPEVPREISVREEIIKKKPLIHIVEDGLENLSPCDPMFLRRSKRPKIQPERFVGDGGFSREKSSPSRAKRETKRKRGEPESSSIDLCQYESDCSIHSESSIHNSRKESDGDFEETSNNTQIREMKRAGDVGTKCISSMTEHHKRDKTTSERKKPTDDQLFDVEVQHSNSVSQKNGKKVVYSLRNRAITTICGTWQADDPTRTETVAIVCRPIDEKTLSEQAQQSDRVTKQTNLRTKSSVRKCDTLMPSTSVDPPHATTCSDVVVLDQPDQVLNLNEKVGRRSSNRHISCSKKRKKLSSRKNREVKKETKKIGSEKAFRSKCSLRSRRRAYDAGSYRRRSLSINECKEIIEKCMKNIDAEISKDQQPAVYQWEEILSYHRWKLPRTPPSSDPVEDPELEDLWKEMEMMMPSLQFLDENPTDVFGAVNKSSANDGKPCQHEYILNEQVGTICRLCNAVGTEMRYILPPFLEKTGRMRNMEYDLEFESRYAENMDLNGLDLPAVSSDESILDKNGSVWALIPNLRNTLHTHQKNAFEFLWNNIAGSLIPADMSASLERTGGCVISHSPGAGKTLLIISFLVSYLKLFPWKRPVILVPKTTLHTWYKEFKKWEVSIPVYQIHARDYCMKMLKNKKVRATRGKLNQDVMHTVDCLEKFAKWHQRAGVLLMSYPSFLSLMKGSSVFEHWRYMARIITQSPGLLILDEGHNPRSTKSTLRKTLMQVKTEQRILLSGTLFQNNFEEYFNTLCLARPRFISEVLKALHPRSRRKRNAKDCFKNHKEKRARKYFIEKVANRINSDVDEEKTKGLNILKKITHDFIDVYDGCASDRLPGLKSCALLIKPTILQQEFLAMLKKNSTSRRYPIEVELLINFVSIHPWLVTTLNYSSQYYKRDELKELENYKLDLRKGSKVRFVVELVCRCSIKREKVLIFSRYIAPMNLFVEIFKNVFGWTDGDQVLVLHGKQELWERSRVIDKFEKPGGLSQVLLASISACSEGISLTAASRVVFLDSEWNPSKTKQAVARAFRPGQERVVYVYQLLASGTFEEDKYRTNAWKERVSRLLLVGTEDSPCSQSENVDDQVLKEIMEVDRDQFIQLSGHGGIIYQGNSSCDKKQEELLNEMASPGTHKAQNLPLQGAVKAEKVV